MNCTLCEKPIRNYEPAFNHLEIDESRAVDICQECCEKFVRWQGNKIAKLFPSKAAKKLFGKNK